MEKNVPRSDRPEEAAPEATTSAASLLGTVTVLVNDTQVDVTRLI